MSLTWDRPRPFRRVESDTAGPRATGLLAVLLVVGLVAVAPAIAWLLRRIGLGGELSLVAGVGVVGAVYGLVVLLRRRVALGAVVATVVTATFAADFPLAGGVGEYPGSLGPELWLVHLPLFALVGVLALRGSFGPDSVFRVEYALGAFVLWSVVVAFVGPVPRPDVALWYSLFSLYCLLAFGVAARSVAADVVSLEGVLASFLVAVVGHVAFAALQAVSQGVFGLSALGETTRTASHTVIHLGPLGGFHIGVFVSGLTGGSGAIAVLIVIALPVALAVALRREGIERLGVLVAVAAMAAILRFTAKDAARAAAIIAVAAFAAFLVWDGRARLRSLTARSRLPERTGRLLPHALLVLTAVGSLFLPSTVMAGTGGPGGTGGTGGPAGAGGSSPGSFSVPFFNLNTLDVRVVQYLVGLDISLRHPILGVGGANFRYAAAAYDVPALDGLSLHNLYLSVLVGTGIPGLLLYSLALGLVFLAGWRLLRTDSPDRTLLAGALAGLFGFLAVAFWVLPLRFTYVLPFWMISGAVVGGSRRRAGDGRPGSSSDESDGAEDESDGGQGITDGG